MSRPEIDQAWLERQLARFKSGDMDEAIRLMRGYDRTGREQARRDAARRGAA